MLKCPCFFYNLVVLRFFLFVCVFGRGGGRAAGSVCKWLPLVSQTVILEFQKYRNIVILINVT